MKDDQSCFDTASAAICGRIRSLLKQLPWEWKEQAQEIRLRINRPVAVCGASWIRFLGENGEARRTPDSCVTATKEDLEETFRRLCGESVYSCQNEIRNGYLTIPGGHRAGLCGSAVLSGDVVTGMRDISSVNLRIARQKNGCADELFRLLGGAPEGGLLLAGPPSSGKTTLLRDIARQLASGKQGEMKKVVLVDERGELAGTFSGVPQNEVGVCCDVLDGYPKGEGILHAVRSLSPDFIVFDELGSLKEAEAVEEGLNAGVAAVTSVHAGTKEELGRRAAAVRLLRAGAFSHVVLLDRKFPGRLAGIYKAGDLLAETDRNFGGVVGGGGPRLYGIA